MTMKKQQGLGLIGWIFFLVVIGFIGLMTMRLGPVYLNHYKAVQAMHAMSGSTLKVSAIDVVSIKKDVWENLERRFSVDDVTNITQDNISVQPEQGDVIVEVQYEVRTYLIANIDAVLSFSDSVTVPMDH